MVHETVTDAIQVELNQDHLRAKIKFSFCKNASSADLTLITLIISEPSFKATTVRLILQP